MLARRNVFLRALNTALQTGIDNGTLFIARRIRLQGSGIPGVGFGNDLTAHGATSRMLSVFLIRPGGVAMSGAGLIGRGLGGLAIAARPINGTRLVARAVRVNRRLSPAMLPVLVGLADGALAAMLGLVQLLPYPEGMSALHGHHAVLDNRRGQQGLPATVQRLHNRDRHVQVADFRVRGDRKGQLHESSLRRGGRVGNPQQLVRLLGNAFVRDEPFTQQALFGYTLEG